MVVWVLGVYLNLILALLAEQGWRLINQPNPLLARTLKEKYYPIVSFLESRLGHLPSFTWRSIWATKPTLEAGLCWRIGNGSTIDVRMAAWVPTSPNCKSQHPIQNLSIATVADLINSNTMCWKEDLISSTFHEEDARRILSIPLPSTLMRTFKHGVGNQRASILCEVLTDGCYILPMAIMKLYKHQQIFTEDFGL